jgi:hypothetical protein
MSNKFWNFEKVCGEIDRNPSRGIILRFKVVEKNENVYFDIREFFLDKDKDEYRPTKKGIVVPFDMFNEFIENLKKIENEINKDKTDIEEIEELLRK